MSPAPQRDPVWLWRLCLILAGGLLAGWSASRLKPVYWFGGLFGVLLGAVAVALQQWLGVKPSRRSATEAVCCAMLGLLVTFGMTVWRVRSQESKQPADRAASALIATLEQMSDQSADQSLPEISESQETWPQSFMRWVARRYGADPDGTAWLYLGVETLLAGIACGVLWSIGTRRQAPISSQETTT